MNIPKELILTLTQKIVDDKDLTEASHTYAREQMDILGLVCGDDDTSPEYAQFWNFVSQYQSKVLVEILRTMMV